MHGDFLAPLAVFVEGKLILVIEFVFLRDVVL